MSKFLIKNKFVLFLGFLLLFVPFYHGIIQSIISFIVAYHKRYKNKEDRLFIYIYLFIAVVSTALVKQYYIYEYSNILDVPDIGFKITPFFPFCFFYFFVKDK